MNIGQPDRLLPLVTNIQSFNITAIKIYPFDTGNVQIFLRSYGGMTLEDFVVIKDFSVLVKIRRPVRWHAL